MLGAKTKLWVLLKSGSPPKASVNICYQVALQTHSSASHGFQLSGFCSSDCCVPPAGIVICLLFVCLLRLSRFLTFCYCLLAMATVLMALLMQPHLWHFLLAILLLDDSLFSVWPYKKTKVIQSHFCVMQLGCKYLNKSIKHIITMEYIKNHTFSVANVIFEVVATLM